jgi:hypothetical protein
MGSGSQKIVSDPQHWHRLIKNLSLQYISCSRARSLYSPNDAIEKQGAYEGPGCTTVKILNQVRFHFIFCHNLWRYWGKQGTYEGPGCTTVKILNQVRFHFIFCHNLWRYWGKQGAYEGPGCTTFKILNQVRFHFMVWHNLWRYWGKQGAYEGPGCTTFKILNQVRFHFMVWHNLWRHWEAGRLRGAGLHHGQNSKPGSIPLYRYILA